jgi:hypothetical protein
VDFFVAMMHLLRARFVLAARRTNCVAPAGSVTYLAGEETSRQFAAEFSGFFEEFDTDETANQTGMFDANLALRHDYRHAHRPATTASVTSALPRTSCAVRADASGFLGAPSLPKRIFFAPGRVSDNMHRELSNQSFGGLEHSAMRRKDGALKSVGEQSTAGLLRRYFHGKQYVIHKDVALNQVLELDRNELPTREFDYYTRASLDFLVCRDDARFTYELAIEYDGAQHEQPQQAWRDEVKNRICRDSNLPLLRIGQDAVTLRRNATILEFILDQYFGEKAVSSLREAGQLSWEDEYSAQFPATAVVQKLLMDRGLFPPVFALDPTYRLFWYQILTKKLEHPDGSGAGSKSWKATTQVNIYEGPSTEKKVFHVTRCASIRDPNPSYSVEGIHGWHIVSELATYLCFDYIEREWLPEEPRRATS